MMMVDFFSFFHPVSFVVFSAWVWVRRSYFSLGLPKRGDFKEIGGAVHIHQGRGSPRT
jgi:hypothetical protein